MEKLDITDPIEALFNDAQNYSDNRDFRINAVKKAFAEDNSFTKCIELQDTVNAKKIGAGWLEGENNTNWPTDFSIASIAEIGECLDSSSYAWWKKEKTKDTENMITELIDVLHFEISKLLQGFPKDPELRNAIMVSSWATSDIIISKEEMDRLSDYDKQVMFNQLIKKLIFFISMPEEFKPDNTIESFVAVFVTLFDLFRVFDVSKEDIIKRYYIKNALNTLRSNYGYKEKKYIKSWIDIAVGTATEDNYIALKICKGVELNFDKIYDTLENYYIENVLAEVE